MTLEEKVDQAEEVLMNDRYYTIMQKPHTQRTLDKYYASKGWPTTKDVPGAIKRQKRLADEAPYR